VPGARIFDTSPHQRGRRQWIDNPGHTCPNADLLHSTITRYRSAVARSSGFAIPGFVITLIWIVAIILVIILLAYIVHLTGGGEFVLKLGHFSLQIGVN